MTRLKFLPIVFLFVFHTLTAQVHLGLNGGFHFSQANQSNFYYSNAVSRPTHTFGAVLDIPLTRNLSVLLNPTYIEKETSASPFHTLVFSPTISFNLSYLELPLLVKYSVGNKLKPYILFGPTLGINLSSSLGAEIQGLPFAQIELEADANDLVDDLEYSLELGGGLMYQIDEFLDLSFEARYSHGLNNIIKSGRINGEFADEILGGNILNHAVYKSKGFSINLGFTFPVHISE
ncbi:MAG: porin family protein [bacterium]